MMQFFIDNNRLAWTSIYALIFLTLLILGTDLVWRISKIGWKVLLLSALSIGAMGLSAIFKFS